MALNKKHEALPGASGMSDLRSMMGLGGAPGEKRVYAPKRKPKPPKPRLSGVARELYELMGDNAPALQLARPKVKGAANAEKVPAPVVKLLGKDGKFVRHWAVEPFVNQARSDSLQLRHWAPASETSEGGGGKGKASTSKAPMYPFAKFNVVSNVFAYTDEEYAHCLADDAWTREETDHLFALCRQFDLRWVIIADRYMETDGDWKPRPKILEVRYSRRGRSDPCRRSRIATTPAAVA